MEFVFDLFCCLSVFCYCFHVKVISILSKIRVLISNTSGMYFFHFVAVFRPVSSASHPLICYQTVIHMSHLFCSNVVILWSQLSFLVAICHVRIASVMLVIFVFGHAVQCTVQSFFLQFNFTFLGLSLKFCSHFVIALSLVRQHELQLLS
jgi:hypothetical protein